MTQINAMSVSLSLNAGDYINSSKLSRQETSSLVRTINSSRTPADRYERSLNQLEKAYKAGAIDLKTYNALLDRQRAKFKSVSQAATKQSRVLDGLSGKVKGVALAFASVATARQAVTAIRGQMIEVDELVKSARGLGENVNQLQRFQFAASELAGVDGPKAIKMLQMLEAHIGELAAVGTGKAKQAMEVLGVSLADLETQSPVEKFRTLSAAISEVEEPTRRVGLVKKIFNKQAIDLLPLLMAESEAFDKSAANVDKLGLAIDSLSADRLEETNDSLGRLTAAFDGLVRSALQIPAMSGALDFVSGIISAWGAWNELIVGSNASLERTVQLGVRLGVVSAEQAQGFERAMDKANASKATESQKALEAAMRDAGMAADELGGAAESAAEKSASAAEKGQRKAESVIEQLEIEKIALTEGKEAAEQYRLKLAGVSEEDRNRIADLKSVNNTLREQNKVMEKITAEEEKRKSVAEKTAQEQRKSAAEALQSARDRFEEEIERRKQMRDQVTSLMSGAGAKAGSSEAVAFIAQQRNREMANRISKPPEQPTERELLKEAKRQYAEQQKQTEQSEQMVDRLDQLITLEREGGTVRYR